MPVNMTENYPMIYGNLSTEHDIRYFHWHVFNMVIQSLFNGYFSLIKIIIFLKLLPICFLFIGLLHMFMVCFVGGG